MTVTAAAQTPYTPVVTPTSQRETANNSPVRLLVNTENLKIEHIYEEETDDQGDTYVLTEQVRITTGDKSDQVRIYSGANGQISAFINGMPYELPISAGDLYQTLVINTDGGDDDVFIDSDINVAVDIYAGDGSDHVRAGGGKTRVFGGKGDDFIQMGSANGLAFGEDGDDVMIAGSGPVVMSGGNHNDRMYAGRGPENRVVYLSGDNGNDELYGGEGKVILNGGLDDDTLVSYRRTTMYTGNGQDRVHSYSPDDHIYAKKNDLISNHYDVKVNEVGASEAGKRGFKIEGSPEFTSRIENKLEELRGSPVGQKVLEEMDKLADKIGSPVTIKSAPEGGNIDVYRFKTAFSESLPPEERAKYNNAPESGHIKDGVPGAVATQAEIVIASDHFDGRLGLSPLVSLFHEMIHAYNGATGTRIPGEQSVTDLGGKPLVIGGVAVEEDIHELQTVGIPNSGEPFDFDNDSATPPTTINPYPFFENAMREELDIPLRERYTPV